MPITRFTRPFTDEEREKLEQRRLRLESPQPRELVEVLEPILLLAPFQWLERFLDSIASWLLVPVITLVVSAWCGLGIGLLSGMGLVLLRIVYPRRVRESRRYRERDEATRRQHRTELEAAQLAGVMHSVCIVTDAFVELEGDGIYAGEYQAGFCRVAENQWLLLAPVEEWYSELALSWHVGSHPSWVSSAGEELIPIAERSWPMEDDIANHGDLFSLTLEELLAATPETFRKAYRGNVFQLPDDVLAGEG